MRNASTQRASLQNVQRPSWRSRDGMQWTIGIVVTVATAGVLLIAVALAPISIRANNNLCLQQIASDEHTSLEAFFQNPVEQDAFVQAVTACSH